MTRVGQPRPLDPLRSIKVKLGAVVFISVVATVGAIFGFLHFGLPARVAFGLGLVISVALIQLLAHGMVLPLREMAAATKAMARGDYHQRVTSTAQDEVGTLARSFNAMAAELEQVETQRKELIANVSHELRTPIASMRARLENLADGIDPLDHDAIDAMLRTTGRLSGLVDQLLELSQFESGSVQIHPTRFPLSDLLHATVDEVAPVRADVHLVVDVAPEVVASGDRPRLHDVLANLLSNAVRHSPTNGSVTVRGTSTPSGTRIDVTDEGPGIPSDELQRVFDRFHRVDSARSVQVGGAGLGLAISRSIIDLHGGSIRAEHHLPHGCRMVVELPG